MDNKGVVSKLLDLRENLRDFKKVITETTLKMKLQYVEVKTEDEQAVAPNRKINKKYIINNKTIYFILRISILRSTSPVGR